MRLIKEDKDVGYGICVNSCDCEVIKNRKKMYKVYKGSLAKLSKFNENTSVGLTLSNDGCKLYSTEPLCFLPVEPELYKYLNAINDFEERLKFYRNVERREFVQHLKKDGIVGVVFLKGTQTKASFHGLDETKEKMFITVKLLESPPSLSVNYVSNNSTENCILYSLPANMIGTFTRPDIDQKEHENLQNDKILHVPCSSQKDNRDIFQERHQSGVLHLVLRPKRDFQDNIRTCDNVQNYSTSNVRKNKSISVSVEAPKTKTTSQNPIGSGLPENYDDLQKNKTLVTSYNKASNDEHKNDFPDEIVNKYDEKPVDSALIVSSNLTTDIPINSSVSVECSKVCETNICISNDDDKENIVDHNNSQTNSEAPINSLEINTHHEINDCVTNEDDLPDNSKIAVKRNISASNCIICKNHLDISEGFFLILCKHTFCETCIKKQMNLEKLEHTNIMPCCDRLIELDEIKYFLYNHEYEQFKARNTQQCFDKNCTGYYLWKDRDEARPFTYKCNKCELENCLKCRTIHINLTCEQYDKIRNSVDKETVEIFLTWIREGIAMPCPKCEALIEKVEGCDWVQCLFCNTEICWVTRGPRWGPEGKGDTSGGCGCDYEVKKCVENCNYCH